MKTEAGVSQSGKDFSFQPPVPMEGSGLKWEVEPWPEPVEGAALLDELERVLKRFVVLPKWGGEALALWVLHTYAFGLRDVSTYVGIESPEKRGGKTTLLAALGELVNRPVVAANISSPAFFRVIEEARPTLVIDEADTFLQGNDELRGILNAGYNRKTAYVVRVSSEVRSAECGVRMGETDDRWQMANGRDGRSESAARRGSRLARFSCWCPKVMAAIGRLPDTLADRCIVVRMHRKLAGEECERLRSLDGSVLRRKCARFVMEHGKAIAEARPEIPGELNDRAADIWEPLLALADLAGGDWPEKARQAAAGLTVSAQESSPIGSLLLDILIVFAEIGGGRIFSRTLVERLNGFADRPWAGMRRGKPVTELWVARQLRPYGVRPRTLRAGERVAKGYVEDEFREAFRRYIPRAEFEELKAELLRGTVEKKSEEMNGVGASRVGERAQSVPPS